jgi:hypothetical protein
VQPTMTSQVMRGPKIALFTVALMAAVVSSMLHLAHIEGRMTGAPKTWTVWVAVDAVLAVLPLTVPAITVIVQAAWRRDRVAAGTSAFTTFLVSASVGWAALLIGL